MAIKEEHMDLLRAAGANIARSRADRGLSIERLAQLAKVGPEALTDIEAGRMIDFDIDMLGAIADALEIEAYRLVMRPGDVDPAQAASPA